MAVCLNLVITKNNNDRIKKHTLFLNIKVALIRCQVFLLHMHVSAATSITAATTVTTEDFKKDNFSGVNFINVKRANFSYEHRFGSFFPVTCT